jgi:glycosyltransferase involved in cell wall biosynthesis
MIAQEKMLWPGAISPINPTQSPGSRHLRIGIDGRNLIGPRRGDGRYVFELCRRLDEQMPHARFFVYSSVPAEMPVLSDRWVLRAGQLPFFRCSPILWLKLYAGIFCSKDHLDVFWGTNAFLPVLSKKVRKVVTVHDICYRVVPDTFLPAHLLANHLFFKRDINRSDVVIANSLGTARRLRDLFGFRAVIIPPAVDKAFRPQSDIAVKTCLEFYDIDYPYILNVSAWEPRKNLDLLAKSFLRIKHQGLLPRHKLVLAGKKSWKSDRLAKLVARDGNERIVFLGYVPDGHLPQLYAGADAFVFPSIYEGFGMPVIEARACGTRVVTSDTPELREAGGSDVIYIDPTEEGIRTGILAALEEPWPGSKSSGLPTWEDSAIKLAAVLRSEEC